MKIKRCLDVHPDTSVEWFASDLSEHQRKTRLEKALQFHEWSSPDVHVLDTQELDYLNALKLEFEKIPSSEFCRTRSALNRFESLGRHIFMNRSAMKLANMDHILDGALGASASFVDICGGPGGFSEYLTWRCASGHAIL